ncbi:hypothetical protein FOZ62_007389, partial [Perkinsus olseni]
MMAKLEGQPRDYRKVSVKQRHSPLRVSIPSVEIGPRRLKRRRIALYEIREPEAAFTAPKDTYRVMVMMSLLIGDDGAKRFMNSYLTVSEDFYFACQQSMSGQLDEDGVDIADLQMKAWRYKELIHKSSSLA